MIEVQALDGRTPVMIKAKVIKANKSFLMALQN